MNGWLIWLMSLVLPAMAFAQDPGGRGVLKGPGDLGAKFKTAPDSAPNWQGPPGSVDSNGQANFDFPIAVPTGPRGMAPSLAIRCLSGSGHGNCGLDARLTLGFISRDTKNGRPTYEPTRDTFQASLPDWSGVASP
jgi:hypothetical protein